MSDMGRSLRWAMWIAVPAATATVAYRNLDVIRDSMAVIATARWPWLALGLVAVACLYVCRAMVYRTPLAVLGYRFPRRFLWETAVIASALQQLFPSGGLSGYAFLTWALHRRGVPSGQAPLIALIDTLSYALVTALLVLGSLASLAAVGILDRQVLTMGLGPGLVILALGVWLYVLQRTRERLERHALAIQRRLASLVHARWSEASLRHFLDEYDRGKALIAERPGRFLGMLAWQIAAVGCDAATLYCTFAALGIFPGARTVLLGFVVALTAGTVISAPAGGGSFEVVLSAFFAGHGVPDGHAVAGALLFRVLSFWVPLAVSAVLLPGFRRFRPDIQRVEPHLPGRQGSSIRNA